MNRSQIVELLTAGFNLESHIKKDLNRTFKIEPSLGSSATSLIH